MFLFRWLKAKLIRLYAKTKTVSPKKVHVATPPNKIHPFNFAKEELGVKEFAGKKHNPRIIEYHKASGGFGSDEIAWCSSFVNWCFLRAGMSFAMSGRANARSWLKMGIETLKPETGDVVIFWRGRKKGWQGHVGFYAGEKGGKILVLGGNQLNQVSYQYYPKDRLLGYRRF